MFEILYSPESLRDCDSCHKRISVRACLGDRDKCARRARLRECRRDPPPAKASLSLRGSAFGRSFSLETLGTWGRVSFNSSLLRRNSLLIPWSDAMRVELCLTDELELSDWYQTWDFLKYPVLGLTLWTHGFVSARRGREHLRLSARLRLSLRAFVRAAHGNVIWSSSCYVRDAR